jgi:hypothetical protein
MRKYIIIDKDWLCEKYISDGLTMKEIASLCNCTTVTIFENLIKYNIPKRKRGLYKRKSEQIEKLRQWHKEHPLNSVMKGKHHSLETRIKMSSDRRGENNSNWKGGKTDPGVSYRNTYEYKQWRNKILERDNFKCQYDKCDEKTNLAHHIKSYKDYTELRIDLNNGISICKKHHNIIHFTKCLST